MSTKPTEVKLLPAEPTPEMIEAFVAADNEAFMSGRNLTPEEGYRTMYAAAPVAASNSAQPAGEASIREAAQADADYTRQALRDILYALKIGEIDQAFRVARTAIEHHDVAIRALGGKTGGQDDHS